MFSINTNKTTYYANLLLLAALLLGGPVMAEAQNSAPPESKNVRSLGGPDGVSGNLERTYREKASTIKKSPFQSYHDWKKRIQEEHEFEFGFTGYWLYQKASESLTDEGH